MRCETSRAQPCRSRAQACSLPVDVADTLGLLDGRWVSTSSSMTNPTGTTRRFDIDVYWVDFTLDKEDNLGATKFKVPIILPWVFFSAAFQCCWAQFERSATGANGVEVLRQYWTNATRCTVATDDEGYTQRERGSPYLKLPSRSASEGPQTFREQFAPNFKHGLLLPCPEHTHRHRCPQRLSRLKWGREHPASASPSEFATTIPLWYFMDGGEFSKGTSHGHMALI